MLILIFIIRLATSQFLNCLTSNSTACLTCQPSYSLYKKNCVSICGYGYISTSNICTSLGISFQFLNVDFTLVKLYNLSSIAGLTTSDGSPFLNAGNMIPTLDRGFYCDSNSNLVGISAWIPTPDLSIKMYFRPMVAYGILMQVKNSNGDNFLKLSMQAGLLTVDLLLISQVDSSISTVTRSSSSQSSSQGLWFNVNIGITQSTGVEVTMTIIISSVTTIFTIPDSEIFISQINQWVLGDYSKLNSARSFYYYLIAANKYPVASFLTYDLSDCDNNFYEIEGQCLACDASCTSRLTCIDDASCNFCYASVCSSCNGYSFNECQVCSNGETPPFCCSLLCRTCTLKSSCDVCTVWKYLYQGVCLVYYPIGGLSPIASPLVSEVFDTTFTGTYGIFTTGTSSSSYNPFVNPETVDPTPSKNRGLYFDGDDYLTNAESAFPHIFSIAFLIKPTSTYNTAVFSLVDSFILSFNPFFIGNFQTDDGIEQINNIGSISVFNSWSLLSVSLSYSYPQTTVRSFLNNLQIDVTSVNGVMRASSTQIYIGIKTGSKFINVIGGFIGFLYKITYWNSPVSDFSSIAYSICANSMQTNCLWACDFTQFLDVDGVCKDCIGCSKGCINNLSCNLCLDPLCSVCSDFGNTCTTCVTNASGPSTGCVCNANTINSYSSCDLCHSSCSTCVGLNRNNCNTCTITSQLMVNGICYNECPDGFKLFFYECVSDGYLVLSLRLYQQNEFGSLTTAGIGSSGSSIQDTNDPQPVPGRGYYFFSNSIISKPNSLVFTEFSLSFWLKVSSDGEIITKPNIIQIYSLSSTLYFIFSSTTPTATYLSGLTLSTSWSNFQIKSSITMKASIQVQVICDNIIVDTFLTAPNQFLDDNRNALEIGSNSGTGFQGFLWSVELLNTVAGVNDFISNCIGTCVNCPSEGVCPSECNYGYPPDNCVFPCADACEVCSSLNNCTNCLDTAELAGGICRCPGKYEWSSTEKRCYYQCFKTCDNCDHYNFQGCLSCSPGYYLFNNVCIDCSLGFIVQGSQCQRSQSLIFDLKLYTGLLTYNQARRLNNQRILNQLTEPIFAYFDRGRYFNGIDSGVLFVDSVILFYPEFSFESWVMPGGNGVILSKKSFDSGKTYFQAELISGRLAVSLMNEPYGILNYSISEPLKLYQWNYLKISLNSIGHLNYEIILYLNKNFTLTFTLPLMSHIFDNRTSSLTTIGTAFSTQDLLSFYQGFIYQIRIFNMFISGFTNPVCSEDCLSCAPSGICIPVCNITSYWQGHSYQNCSLCNSNCTNGCRDDRKACGLCDDKLCSKCENLIQCGTCIEAARFNEAGLCECIAGSVKSTYDCVLCENGYILNNECIQCTQRCLKCNQSLCLLCTNNSYADGTNCLCELGFDGNDTCDYVHFYVSSSVSNDNIIYLDFSDQINKELTTADIKITIYSEKIDFSLSQYTSKRYALSMKIKASITEGTVASLNFIRQIVSIRNGILNISEVNVTLNEYSYQAQTYLAQETKSVSAKVSTASIVSATSLSLTNPNPASLWSFVNTIQLLIFIYLANIPLGDRTSGFLLGLRKYNLFPNLFDYLNVDYGIPHRFSHAEELGFKTNSVLMNVGQWISAFILFVALYYTMRLIVICFSKTRFEKSFVSSLLTEKCNDYKYGFFLRFWIQAYIEILFASLLAIYSSDLNQVGQALNFYLALILLSITVLTPAAAMQIGIMQRKTQLQPQQQSIEKVKLWGTLFYEFKDDAGAAQNHFYTLFFIRRLVFIVILFLLRDYPIVQLCLCEIMMISMFLLVYYMRPFSEFILNISNCIAELGLASIFILIALYLFELSESSKTIIDYFLVIVVNVIVSAQLFASLYIFSKTVYLKLQSRRKAKVGAVDKEEKEFKILIFQPEEAKIGDSTDNNIQDMNRINVSPAISCESSFNLDSKRSDRDKFFKGLDHYFDTKKNIKLS